MLKTRILTALIGLPILISVICFGGELWVSLLFALFCALAVYETSKLLIPTLIKKVCPDSELSTSQVLGWTLFNMLLALCIFFSFVFVPQSWDSRAVVLPIILILSVSVFSQKNIDQGVSLALSLISSLSYGALPWLSLWELYKLSPSDARYLLLLMTVVMGNDSGAYFFGTALGKRRMAPHLSPKKSWEGFWGGLLVASLLALGLNQFYELSYGPWPMMIALASLGAVFGTMGDLVESAFKRFAGVKDSGVLFPGHGGLLDRADSIVFVAPLLLMILKLNLGA